MNDFANPRIAVGVDGSRGAKIALQWAVADAKARGGTVTAVMAWTFLDQRTVGDQPAFDPSYDDAAADRALAQYLIDTLGTDDAGLVARRPICDLAASALITASKDFDILVVGSRGLGGFKGLVLGSVAQKLVSYSSRPVVVVPTPPEPEN